MAGALTGGVILAYQVIIEAGFRRYGTTTLSIRDYTLISTPFIVVLSLSVSYASGRCGFFKGFLVTGNFIHLAFLIMLALFYRETDPFMFGLTFIVTAATLVSQSGVGVEYLS